MILTDINTIAMLKQAREYMEQGSIKVLTPEIITQLISEYQAKYKEGVKH